MRALYDSEIGEVKNPINLDKSNFIALRLKY